MAGAGAMETPLMKQYNAIKAKYPGALLLFRVGDFYETFGEDAIAASKVLDIVLTKRGNGSASEIELAGFPHHSLDVYLPKLVRAGHRVAICDQLEDPRFVKGIVKRGVTELVTPGVSYNDNVLERKRNNFLASVYATKDQLGIALLDISTGEFYCAQGSENYVWKLIQSLSPAEIIFSKAQRERVEKHVGDEYATFALDDWVFAFDFAQEKLLTQFKTATLKGFGIDGLDLAIIAAGAVLQYLEATEHRDTHQCQRAHPHRNMKLRQHNQLHNNRHQLANHHLKPQHQLQHPIVNDIDHRTHHITQPPKLKHPSK
jgi:DNA mismatch repair protein MutS